MPFVLTNAPAVFQHMMNDIFREYLDQFVVIYLDDILIFSQDYIEHTKHVRLILSKLREHGLYAKPEKCEFDRTSVEFLGYVISSDGLTMDKKKVATVQEWEVPMCNRFWVLPTSIVDSFQDSLHWRNHL